MDLCGGSHSPGTRLRGKIVQHAERLGKIAVIDAECSSPPAEAKATPVPGSNMPASLGMSIFLARSSNV